MRRDIAAAGIGRTAALRDRGRNLLRQVEIQIDESDAGPMVSKRFCNRSTDSAGPAGNHSDLAVKTK